MNQLTPATELAEKRGPGLPDESADYAAARKALLADEIEVRRALTRLAEHRRALPPGPKVQRDYRFKDENGDEVGLADLFGKHDTLVTYFWMYGPDRDRPCPMCTNALGAFDGNTADVKQRAAFKILGRSSVERQKAFALERGWRDLEFIQTVGDDYALDHQALDPDKGWEFPAYVVFRKNADGTVRYFYAAEMPAEAADPGQDPRGAVDFAPLWHILDTTPEGRGNWYPKLSY